MKTLITSIFVLICSVIFAQQHATSYTKCQLLVNDILREQSFEMDDLISEEAMYILYEMYEELNFIYKCDCTDIELQQHISSFNKALQKARDLNLNISMFQEDIEHVSNLSQ